MTHFHSLIGTFLISHFCKKFCVFFPLHAVISRNILNDEASLLVPSENTADDKNLLAVFQVAAVADTQQAEHYDMEKSNREEKKQEVLLQDDALKGNDSTTEGNGDESVGVGLAALPAGGAVVDVDMAKPAHADEM